jgi:hypothetical protein
MVIKPESNKQSMNNTVKLRKEVEKINLYFNLITIVIIYCINEGLQHYNVSLIGDLSSPGLLILFLWLYHSSN